MRLISIIIPVYHHEKALPKALASIAAQTYKNIEVIIVDDGSKPGLQLSDFRLQLRLMRQEHRGAPAARNRGFRESKGEYVIFWDADIIAEPEMLEKMLAALDAEPEANYAYSNFNFGRKKMPARAFDAQALKKNNYINTVSLIRRSAAIPWDESLKRFQDWDYWLMMLEQGKTGVWVPEFLYRAIPHRGGISAWLPSFAYRAPWKYLPGISKKVVAYNVARQRIVEKHHLDHAAHP